MKMTKISLLLMLIGSFLLFSKGSTRILRPRNKLIYILIDGFRYDYVRSQPKENLPGFNQLLSEGVQAEYMSPIFPSISYPDWTTLITGLWAESHGIVGNYFYDSEHKDNFSLFDADSTGKSKWWTAEPIWTTATKENLKTAVILWSRCDIPFDGVVPEYCEPFIKIRGFEIFQKNIEKAIDKLKQGYDLIQVYNEHTDNIGHDFGPETEELKQAVRDLDKTIVFLLQQIEDLGMKDEVNIVIVSDHGMVNVAPGTVQRVELDDYLLTKYVENIADAGAYCNIKVKNGFTKEVYDGLKKMPGVEVYLHDEIPDALHYRDNKYIHDIVIKADIDTFIMKSRSAAQLPPRSDYVYQGAHGFDNREEKMQTIFYAYGPDFKKGVQIPAIQNVDVYPLLAHLLQVPPRPNNGTLQRFSEAVVNPIPTSASYRLAPASLVGFLPLIALFRL